MAEIGIKVMQKDKTIFLQILPLFHTSFLLAFTKGKKSDQDVLSLQRLALTTMINLVRSGPLKSFPYSLSPDLSLVKLFVLFDGNIKSKCLGRFISKSLTLKEHEYFSDDVKRSVRVGTVWRFT